ncbi:MAG: hypothetical protein KatS3mg091_354 [Patescibacteria group bacterium]|nr:MAG: hypothetical protein KatS3mg091_354 [Patescibacteria group bacterium]
MRSLGKVGEQIALDYLQKQGYSLVEQNFFARFSEIDLIVKKEKKLVFCEVKLRTSFAKGKPFEAVTDLKINRLLKAVDFFLSQRPEFAEFEKHLWVISIVLTNNKPEIQVLEFDGTGF